MAVTIYLMLGVAGCPVFAGGAAGLDTLTGGSGGFLIGFIFSGLFVSDRLYKKSDSSFGRVLQVMLVATFILFLFGLIRLTSMYDWSRAIDYGLKDFWIMALVKAVLAALTVKLIFFRQGRTKH